MSHRRWRHCIAAAFTASAVTTGLMAPHTAAAAVTPSSTTFTASSSATAVASSVRPGTRKAFSTRAPRGARGAYLSVQVTHVKAGGTVRVCGRSCPTNARIKVSRKGPVVRTVFVPLNANGRAVIRSSAKAKVVARSVGFSNSTTAPRLRAGSGSKTLRGLSPRRQPTIRLARVPANATAVVLKVKTWGVRKSGTITVCSTRDRSSACKKTVRAISTKGRSQTTTTVVPLKGAQHVRLRTTARTAARVTVTGYVVPSSAGATKRTSPAPKPKPAPSPTTDDATHSGGPGVSDAAKLTPHYGDLTITKPGTVISNMEIFGRVSIKAANVTIKNSRIRAQKPNTSGVVNTKSPGVLIQDTEIFSDHDNTDTNGVMGWGFTLNRVEIHSVVDQVHIHGAGNVTIKDSDFHSNIHWENDPNWGGKPTHDDNIQIVSGSNITIEGTTLRGSHSAAVMLGQDAGRIAQVTLRRNVIGGGACSINIAPKSYGPISGLTVTDNTFTRTQTKHAGCAVIAPSTSVPSMSNNVWTPSGETVKVSRG